jgi:hypothetical protein
MSIIPIEISKQPLLTLEVWENLSSGREKNRGNRGFQPSSKDDARYIGKPKKEWRWCLGGSSWH